VADTATASGVGSAGETGSAAPALPEWPLVLPDGQPKLLLTPEEAARALGIGRTKLYELLATAKLPSVRIDGSRRVSVGALTEFVRGLTPTSGSARVR
jgi:excisionase family DNA binding protein